MKNSIIFFGMLAIITVSNAQPKQSETKPSRFAKSVTKFGALAIDKSNGFYFGFSYDQPTQVEAEKRAMEECIKRGGKGIVVLVWSGEGCAAYRTIAGNSVNDAFGWGVAKTRAEADIIATNECLKRSNGTTPSNFVWACNSTTSEAVKTIRNDIGKFKPTLKAYAIEEKGLSYIKLGDKVLLSTSMYRFKNVIVPGELFLFQLRSDNDFYKYINPLCIVDKNGIQKTFGGEMYFEQVETFLPYDINKKEGTDFGWGIVTVKNIYSKDKRFGASFHGDTKDEIEKAMRSWSGYKNGKDPDDFSNIYYDKIVLTDKNFVEKETRNGYFCFQQFRSPTSRTYYKTEFNNMLINSK